MHLKTLTATRDGRDELDSLYYAQLETHIEIIMKFGTTESRSSFGDQTL
jgi:hypothetical protein